MSRIITSISILKHLAQEATEAASTGRFPGVSHRSAVIEFALDRLLHPENYLGVPVIEQVEAPAR
jgi:hypothetical protein